MSAAHLSSEEARWALTLIQPWAYAIEECGKRIETRTWTPPRWAIGRRIYIHAGAKLDRDAVDGLQHRGYDLPAVWIRKSIGCSVVLRGWVRHDGQFGGELSREAAQRVLGDPWYVPGQIAWVLDELRLIAPRVAVAGRLGLWRVAS